MSSHNSKSDINPFMCSICREQENSADKLISPCKCSGTIKYVHYKCIALWITTKSTNKCLICHSVYNNIEIRQKNRTIFEFIQSSTLITRLDAIYVILSFVILFFISISSFIRFHTLSVHGFGQTFTAKLNFYASIVVLFMALILCFVSINILFIEFKEWQKKNIKYEALLHNNKNP